MSLDFSNTNLLPKHTRDKMSYADREQRDLIVENLYNTFKADIENSN